MFRVIYESFSTMLMLDFCLEKLGNNVVRTNVQFHIHTSGGYISICHT